MFNILCYGDSLTWGYNPDGPVRHAFSDRWPSVLQRRLGSEANVIADGLNGRTTAFDDRLASEDRNGATTLTVSLATHSPLDLVIIMLGTNDTKPWIHGSALVAKKGMARLAQIVRTHPYQLEASPPRLVIMSPPAVSWIDSAGSELYERANQDSHNIASHYRSLSEEIGCGYFDASTVANVSPLDGVHLDAANTRAIGDALVPTVLAASCGRLKAKQIVDSSYLSCVLNPFMV